MLFSYIMLPGCPFLNLSYISSNLHPILGNLSFILLSVCALVCPSTHLSGCLAHLIGGGVVLFLTGLLFHKINKWYLRSRVESITNGTWRKGNLGRSVQAATATEWVFTVKYNQCITKHITRGLLKKPSTPRSPLCPFPIQWKCPTLSLPTWFNAESQSEKVGAGTYCWGWGELEEWQSERWSFYNSLTHVWANMVPDTQQGVLMSHPFIYLPQFVISVMLAYKENPWEACHL